MKVKEALGALEPHKNIFQPPSKKGTVIFPGFDGGGEWGGAAYDPATNLLYINANQVPWSLTMVKNSSEAQNSTETIVEHGLGVYLTHCMFFRG